MNCRIALVIGVTILSSSVPAHAQFQWPQWSPFGGWEQPQHQRSEPRRERRSYTRHYHHSEPRRHDADDSRSKPQSKPKVEYRTRTVVKTWNDMSQDKARDWLLKQIQDFCSKYPSDAACKAKEVQ